MDFILIQTRERQFYERQKSVEFSDINVAKNKGQQIAVGLRQTIHHFFPDIYTRLEAIEDLRKRRDYSITEIILGGIFLFICREGSRNALNSDRSVEIFRDNYEILFSKRLPHMDTVDAVLRRISHNELECLKAALISSLIEKKVFGQFRLFNAFYRVAVDATGS